jgi:hypothetical protein
MILAIWGNIVTRRISFMLLWLGFISYAFFLAPPDDPHTAVLIGNLINMQLDGINPLIVALFNLMGIFPMLYGCLMFTDGRGQKLPAWLFAITSFAVGAFAILPYLAWRSPNPYFSGQKGWGLLIWESRLTGIVLLAGAIGLLYYGITQGNWADFVQQWQTSRFIHVMSLDFLMLCLVFPALLGDDMARRKLDNPQIFWAVSLFPLLGSLLYLCLRPSLPISSADSPVTISSD